MAGFGVWKKKEAPTSRSTPPRLRKAPRAPPLLRRTQV